ncbi:biotin/lipoyl-binding protein [Blautia sp.]|uniref:biotin/lipoyl-binding protein n=1 Tax=Blautia sp. TaxID=1955243 RepID=UPI002626BC5B|nr:biotin/lipoyl-binding protein [Blautia sp.]
MKKKIKIAVLSGGAVLVLGVGIWFGVSRFQKGTVPVYSMEELAQQVWSDTTSLEGSVSSNASQQVRLLDKQIVSQVHVTEGQEVKEGDPLLTYDMTLVNIDLEMEKLNKQQLEVKKKGLEQELKDLKNGKMSAMAANRNYETEFLGDGDKQWRLVETTSTQPGEEQPETPENPNGGESPETPENPNGGETPETPENPDGGETPQQPENPDGGDNPQTPQQPENPDGGETPEEPEVPEEQSTAYSRLYWDTSLTDPIPPKAEDNVIVETAKPYKQEGAVLYFLCKKDVWVQGAFLNHIAGFRGGEEKEEAPLTCVLEQRTEDKNDGTLLAQITIYGEKIEKQFNPSTWYRAKLGLAEWEEVPVPNDPGLEDLDNGIFVPTPGGDIIGGYSPEEMKKAIREKEQEIATAGLDIREADIKIKKVEQQLQDETVRSTLNGVVKKVGDPAKGEIDGEPFIVVESTGGVYIKGYVGEDMLKVVEPGQMLSGMAYESMMPFEAEIKEVSPYPADDYMMYSNREITYYPFTAFIQDSTGLKDNEMVTMDLPQENGEITGIFLSKEYVRSKDGEDYVLKAGKNGKLVKQVVHTGRTFYGSLIEIKDGITTEDYVAFPYGKKVKEGAKVKKAKLADEYNGYF